jgi:hypothetical protein
MARICNTIVTFVRLSGLIMKVTPTCNLGKRGYIVTLGPRGLVELDLLDCPTLLALPQSKLPDRDLAWWYV